MWSTVIAECLPQFEAPSITPDVRRRDGSHVSVRMADLAGLSGSDQGMSALRDVVQAYEDWIDERLHDINTLDPPLHEPAKRHLNDCQACANRMRQGIAYLEEDADARLAFQLRQSRGAPPASPFGPEDTQNAVGCIAESLDILRALSRTRSSYIEPRGLARIPDIAFLLMSLRSSVETADPDREMVKLICFPPAAERPRPISVCLHLRSSCAV